MEGYNRWCRISASNGLMLACNLNEAIMVTEPVAYPEGMLEKYRFKIIFIGGDYHTFNFDDMKDARRVYDLVIQKLGIYGAGLIK